jgi:dolichol-phosphate mannosyltransferase|tara:strand:+ start:4984 stop:5694 length:711 start_codon:yes stop_codon:yes gene_type:complete
MKLSIIIPVRNEELAVKKIIDELQNKLIDLEFEIIFIDDFSTDNTKRILDEIIKNKKEISLFENQKKGLGGAISLGINKSSGQAICIMMSDLSDDINDLKTYYNIIRNQNVDAVFGSRFVKGSTVIDYPKKKLILNRIFNFITKLLFISDYNDFTNAFKIYKKEALLNTFPLVSESFNIFLELPLKIISRKMKYKIIPISWTNRKVGKSKFDIKELRAKYLFTLIYCLLEKLLLKK